MLASANATALNLNSEGEGQALIFPYYTVNGGNSTLISLQNRTPYGKALRVRFHEAQNGRDVLEFNLYLAPSDVWTAAVYSLSDGGPAVLSTDDESCTVPAIKHNSTLPQTASGRRYVPLSNFAYSGPHDDAGTDSVLRTRSGHIEVIEMGVVTNGEGAGAQHTLDAISFGAGWQPRDCAQVIDAWSPFAAAAGAYWLQDPVGAIDLLPPTDANGGGHIVGSAGIVNFAKGTQLTYLADAIEGFSVSVLHTRPDNGSKPQLSDANWPGADGATAQWFDGGELQSARYAAGRAIDAVSALFTQEVIHNEFVAYSVLASEWVLTFPTKRFYVDPERIQESIAPFTQRFESNALVGAGAGVGWHARHFDREMREAQDEHCYDYAVQMNFCGQLLPTPLTPEPRLYDEANVIAIGQQVDQVVSRILGAPRPQPFDLQDGFIDGHLSIQFWDVDSPYFDGILDQAISRPDLDGNRLVGLPVTGFWISQTSTYSVLANFAGIWRHRGTRCRVHSGEQEDSACPLTIPVRDSD